MATSRQITERDKDIGRRIAFYRRARRMTQADVAQAIGVTAQQVQKYENGTNRVSSARLVAIASHLQVGLQVLAGTEDSLGQSEAIALVTIPGALALLRLYSKLGEEDRNALLRLAMERAIHTGTLAV